MEYSRQREILFLRRELKNVYKNINKYCRIEKFFKGKLVEYGVMKQLQNSYSSEGTFTKTKDESFNINEMARAVSF